jgi:hypothetical protein
VADRGGDRAGAGLDLAVGDRPALVSGGGAIDSELAKCSSCTVKWLDTISALQWA